MWKSDKVSDLKMSYFNDMKFIKVLFCYKCVLLFFKKQNLKY